MIGQPVFDTEESDVEADRFMTARVVGRSVFLAFAVGLFASLLVLSLI